MPLTVRQWIITSLVASLLCIVFFLLLYNTNPHGCNYNPYNLPIVPGSTISFILAPFIFLPVVYLVSFFTFVFTFQFRNLHNEKYQEQSHVVYGVFVGLTCFILVVGGIISFFLMLSVASIASVIPCSM